MKRNRLNERDLTRIITRVLNEQETPSSEKKSKKKGIMNLYNFKRSI